jgi:hypothetical protein
MGMDVRAFSLAKVARSTSRGLGMGCLPLGFYALIPRAVPLDLAIAVVWISPIALVALRVPLGPEFWVSMPTHLVAGAVGIDAVLGLEPLLVGNIALGFAADALPENHAHVAVTTIARLRDARATPTGVCIGGPAD